MLETKPRGSLRAAIFLAAALAAPVHIFCSLKRFPSLSLIFIFNYMVCVRERSVCRGQGHQIPLGAEMTGGCESRDVVLETELGSSVRAIHILNH